jgi:hypothetical protein
MNRYNQGFYRFGLMEQCENGQWVKSEDCDRELKRLNAVIIESKDKIIAKDKQLGLLLACKDHIAKELRREVRQQHNRLLTLSVYSAWITIMTVGYFISKLSGV